MSEINKKVELVRSALIKNSPLNHPLIGHPIAECEEFVKQLYIDNLCVIAQYENEDTENQLKFIQRIMAAAAMQESIMENVKNALQLNAEQFGEFIRQCRENKLSDIFLLDSMLIACADGVPNKKQIEFLAEIAQGLGIGRQRLEWLSGLAKCILAQDSDQYAELCKQIPHDERTEILPCIICYLKEFVTGVLVDTDDLLYIYAKTKAEFDFSQLGVLSRKNIIIENIIFKHDKNVLKIRSSEKLEINNCEIENILLNCYCIEKVNIVKSEFYKLNDDDDYDEYNDGFLIIFKNADELVIQESIFDSCNGYAVLGGWNIEAIKLFKCKFVDCVSVEDLIYFSGDVEKTGIILQENKFTGCKCASGYLIFAEEISSENIKLLDNKLNMDEGIALINL